MSFHIMKNRCKSCGLCEYFCPKNAIKKSGFLNDQGFDVISIDEQLCSGCGICMRICPDWAIREK